MIYDQMKTFQKLKLLHYLLFWHLLNFSRWESVKTAPPLGAGIWDKIENYDVKF